MHHLSAVGRNASQGSWTVRRSLSKDNGASGTWETVDSARPPGGWGSAFALAFDSSGNIYVAGLMSTSLSDFSDQSVWMWTVRRGTADGKLWCTIDQWQPAYGNVARSITVDPSGTVYTAGTYFEGNFPGSLFHWVIRKGTPGLFPDDCTLAQTTWQVSGDVPSGQAWSLACDWMGDIFAGGLTDSGVGVGNGDWAIHQLAGPPPRPKLQIIDTHSSFLLTWPATTTGYLVETASSLASPIAWVSAGSTDGASSNFFPIPRTNSAAFYRLRQP